MCEDSSRNQGPQRVIRQLQKRKRTLPRWERQDSTYHVRASIRRERRERLIEPDIAEIVTNSLRYDDGRRYLLHCYVLMPDHFHVILHPCTREDGSVPLPEIMQAIKGSTCHRMNRLRGRRGSFWLDENYSRIIRCPVEYEWTWHYIRCNPITAGYVSRPEEWRWWWEHKP